MAQYKMTVLIVTPFVTQVVADSPAEAEALLRRVTFDEIADSNHSTELLKSLVVIDAEEIETREVE